MLGFMIKCDKDVINKAERLWCIFLIYLQRAQENKKSKKRSCWLKLSTPL